MAASLLTTASDVGTGTAASGTSVTVNKPSGAVAGDFVLAILWNRTTSVQADYTTPPAGWTSVAVSGGATGTFCVYSRTIAAGDPASWTWAGGGSGRHAALMFRTSGLNTASVLDVTGTYATMLNANTAQASVTLPSVTTLSPGDLILNITGTNNTGNTPQPLTAPAGVALAGSAATATGATDSIIAVGQEVLGTAAASGTRVWTGIATSASGSGVLIALKSVQVTPLSVTSSADATSTAVNSPVSLTAVGANGSGTRSYAWTKVSGPSGTFGTPGNASTTYTPTAAGSHVLRVTATDSSGSATADITITALGTVNFATATTTGWTAVGGTAVAALGDADDATYLESADNPSGQTFDLTLPPIVPPTGNLTVPGRFQLSAAGTGSVTAQLLDGATVVATSNTLSLGTAVAAGSLVFPSASLSGVTAAKWQAGTLVVRVAVTAGP